MDDFLVKIQRIDQERAFVQGSHSAVGVADSLFSRYHFAYNLLILRILLIVGYRDTCKYRVSTTVHIDYTELLPNCIDLINVFATSRVPQSFAKRFLNAETLPVLWGNLGPGHGYASHIDGCLFYSGLQSHQRLLKQKTCRVSGNSFANPI